MFSFRFFLVLIFLSFAFQAESAEVTPRSDTQKHSLPMITVPDSPIELQSCLSLLAEYELQQHGDVIELILEVEKERLGRKIKCIDPTFKVSLMERMLWFASVVAGAGSAGYYGYMQFFGM